MTSQQIEQLEKRLQEWRVRHDTSEKLRSAYRSKAGIFTLNSMALENEPVDPKRLQMLWNRLAP